MKFHSYLDSSAHSRRRFKKDLFIEADPVTIAEKCMKVDVFAEPRPTWLASTGSWFLFIIGIVMAGHLSAQTLYVADSGKILKVNSAGSVSNFVSGTTLTDGLAFDSGGNLYAADFGGDRIEEITSGGIATTFAALPNGSEPIRVAFDLSGNLYASDNGTGQISKITPTGIVSVFATLSAGVNGLAFDSVGYLYAADFSAHQIDKISPAGAISLFVPMPTQFDPWGMAFDSSGNLYEAEAGFDLIHKITPAGVVTVFATFPTFNAPTDVAFDSSGTLYAVSSGFGEIDKVSSTGVVSTFATGFNNPDGLAFARTPEPATGMFLVVGMAASALVRRRR